jgi:hypothetical protein
VTDYGYDPERSEASDHLFTPDIANLVIGKSGISVRYAISVLFRAKWLLEGKIVMIPWLS